MILLALVALLLAASPGGLAEVTHITPAPQPPLAIVSDEAPDGVREAFNAAADRTRILLMVSPSCPMCLRGAREFEDLVAQDSSALRVLVVWEHVTPSDRRITIPPTTVLGRVSDPRAIQFWDQARRVSWHVVHDLPADTLGSVAETDTSGTTVAWDCAAVFRPGVRWDDRFPVPDWAGRPIVDVLEGLRRALRRAELTAGTAPGRDEGRR